MLRVWLLSALVLCSAPAQGVTTEEIVAALQPQLLAAFPENPGTIALKPLPKFVREATCDRLQARFKSGFSNYSGAGALPVEIRCEQPRLWSAYVSAAISASADVVTACHSLPRNQPLTRADLCLVARSASVLRQHTLHSVDEAMGMSLKRPLTAGAVLLRTALTASTLVKRGDGLTIESRRGRSVISVGGIALGSGGRGEQIAVRNSQSGRQIRAWIVAPGRVSASAPPTAPVPARDFSQNETKVTQRLADNYSENPAMGENQMTYSE
ncbi:MAG: flagellar basal body P-ring formation chaperone FlgA [Pseudomonadales bacterium]